MELPGMGERARVRPQEDNHANAEDTGVATGPRTLHEASKCLVACKGGLGS